MAVFVVTWNLNKERSNYDQARREFLAVLDAFEHTKDQGLESVRWISTPITATSVNDRLQDKLDKNDRIFISKVNKGERNGWLSQPVWDWINARQ